MATPHRRTMPAKYCSRRSALFLPIDSIAFYLLPDGGLMRRLAAVHSQLAIALWIEMNHLTGRGRAEIATLGKYCEVLFTRQTRGSEIQFPLLVHEALLFLLQRLKLVARENV